MKKTFSRSAVKIPTAERLKNVALFYLSRYAASEASLRRVLENRIRRAKMAHPDFASDDKKQTELRAAIETIIASHKKTGAVNDAVIADMKVASLRRSGKSEKFIRQKLGLGGLKKDIIAHAISQHDGEDREEAELNAARALCKKRRIGQFRPKERPSKDAAQKDFGVLARAGFSSTTIRKVLGSCIEFEE